MPRVPTYDRFQVSPGALPQVRVSAPGMPDIAGQQEQQLGQGLMRAGDAASRYALDVQQQANQIRVDDALNRAKEAALRLTYDKDQGFLSLKGINALERPDGKPLADEYSETLQKQIQDIAGTLGNDAQRQAFDLHADGIVAAMRASAIQHEAREYQTYALSTSEGIQATALRDIALNWNDTKASDAAVERIRAETYRQAQLLGKSAEWQEAQARKQVSNARKVALLAALDQNNPIYADAYLKKYADQMDADDILTVRGHITHAMDAQIGTQAAGEVLHALQPRIETSDAERAFNIAVGTESGGRQFGADGAPLTSSKGAIGIAQVMPDTAPEAAKLAGLTWDDNRYKTDASYNKALGLAYFQKQLQDNGGDLAKAYAAYNAGHGRLQDAIKRAETSAKLHANDPAVAQHTWLDFMPAETQAYVQKNMAEYGAGAGRPPRPTFAEIDDALRADPRLAGNPARYKMARDEAQRLYTEQTAAIKQRDDEAVANAMRTLVQNGGRYSDLPTALRASLPPDKIDTVQEFGRKIARGDDTTSPWLYNKLASHPESLARMSDDEFYALRRELSEADFKHFSQERAKLTGAAPGSNGPGDLNSSAIKSTLDARLRTLNIDPTPKDDGGLDAARVGAIRQFVDQYFLAAQREAGKKFTDAEVTQHLDALFAQNVTFRGFFSNSSGPLLTSKVGDIPSDTRDNLKAAFKARGVDDPTDAQLLQAYFTLQTTRR